MNQLKPIGDAEAATLRQLDRYTDGWTTANKPLWENLYWTERLLNSLARKGYVNQSADGRYTVSEAGAAKISG